MITTKLLIFTCLLLSSQLIPSASAQKQFTAYFQSWSEKYGSKGSDLTLANLPAYVSTVILSFIKPDNSYSSGSLSLSNTGLDFSSDGSVVKEAIQLAKSKGAKVLVAVGGATYTNWDALNEAGIAAFVTDFGLDGVDIDYEPADGGCTQNGGTVTCTTDQKFQDIVSRIRQAVPQPAFLSMAGWSIGAYGEGDFQSAQPQGANTGLCVNLLKSDAGKSLDQVNIMSYDAGSDFDPKQAFQAYRSLFGGKLALGVEVPPEAWGGHVLSMSELEGLCDFVNQNGGDGDGVMLWSLNKKPDGGATDANPDASMISQKVCEKLGLNECDTPLPTIRKQVKLAAKNKYGLNALLRDIELIWPENGSSEDALKVLPSLLPKFEELMSVSSGKSAEEGGYKTVPPLMFDAASVPKRADPVYKMVPPLMFEKDEMTRKEKVMYKSVAPLMFKEDGVTRTEGAMYKSLPSLIFEANQVKTEEIKRSFRGNMETIGF